MNQIRVIDEALRGPVLAEAAESVSVQASTTGCGAKAG